MAVTAMIILGVLIFLLTGNSTLFKSEATLFTFLDDAAAMATGAPVRLNGILIGQVKKIELSGSNQPQRIVRVTMEVDGTMLPSIPVDSVVAISAENVLGTKFINIKKGQSKQTVQNNAEVKALDTRDFDEVVQSGYALLTSLQGILTRVDKIVGLVENGQGSIGKLLTDEELYQRLNLIAADVQKVTGALNQNKGTLGKLLYDEAMYNDVRGTIAHVDQLIDSVQKGQGTAGKLINDPVLYNDLDKTILEMRNLIADLNAGKGTAGKLLKDEDLHNELRATLVKLNTTIDKVNSGQGTVGQLLVNPQLYDSLNGASAELNQFMKDFRKDPRKYLRIKLALF